ncbi:MazG-like family protein [Candidatus Woesearchaeota archaeon]|nr:MazG-like family protein [Candidatus Woesearchaeota archaeon]
MKKIQDKVSYFCKKHNLESSPEHRVLDAMSELGEVAKEILKMSDYGKKPTKYREELKSELGDLFYSLITIANSFNVDLEEALEIVLAKYEKRLKKGSAGSEND